VINDADADMACVLQDMFQLLSTSNIIVIIMYEGETVNAV
jgi:hypothetical protein